MKEGDQFSLFPQDSSLEENNKEQGVKPDSSPSFVSEKKQLSEKEYWDKVFPEESDKERLDALAEKWLTKIRETLNDPSSAKKEQEEKEKEEKERGTKVAHDKDVDDDDYTSPYEEIYPYARHLRKRKP